MKRDDLHELANRPDPECPLPLRENLAEKIKEHWEKHAPKMYRELLKNGKLERLALETADETRKLYVILRKQGLDPVQAASEAMRREALNIT